MRQIAARSNGERPQTCPLGFGVRADIPAAPLSAQLRARTAGLHDQTEILLGLPDAIKTLDHYRAWLGRFLGLYRPLEQALAGFSDWDHHALPLPSPSQSHRLAADLAALGVDPAALPQASPALLPHLPSFAHALGARYVLEGSTLGGRIILRDIEARLGPQIAGATRFFGGRGAAPGQTWQSFKAALDAAGWERPDLRGDVVSGAQRSFAAIATWFAPMAMTAGAMTAGAMTAGAMATAWR